jgi:hypothetical protein
MNSQATDSEAAIPWRGIRALSRLWAGSGSLYDWLGADGWQIDQNWRPDLVRARIAEAILLKCEGTLAPILPKYSIGWLERLEQQLHRAVGYSDHPSPYTDWPATLAEFGHYPSLAYVERRPRSSFDTPLTRVARWAAEHATKADKLIFSVFGRYANARRLQLSLEAAIDTPEIKGASIEEFPSEYDLVVCTSYGGIWRSLAVFARELASLWRGTINSQISDLQPILPMFSSQLFELQQSGV